MEPHDLLLVVDVQNDFCPGGGLPVADGDQVVPVINRLLPQFRHVVLTQDWHPADHASFASRHPGKAPYEAVQMPYGEQTLWPDHCVQGSDGAAFHPDLETDGALAVIRKGMNPSIDSYSAFTENDRSTPTGLGGLLRALHIQRVFLAGLAFDFCVGWSATDARAHGFEAIVLEDATRPVDLPGTVAGARTAMRDAGVIVTTSHEIAGGGSGSTGQPAG